MRKISKPQKEACKFWKTKIKNRSFIVKGRDFPDEYVRKILLREDLAFRIKRGFYLLKDKGSDPQELVYMSYWEIVESLLKKYEPYSIEKKSALSLYLGDESIPLVLYVHTSRNVKYTLSLSSGLKIQIRPDPDFHKKIRQDIKIGKVKLFLDVPEKVLLSLNSEKDTDFLAFLKGTKFDKRILEILYSARPKPVIVKRLIKNAELHNIKDLSKMLKTILKEYTIYRL